MAGTNLQDMYGAQGGTPQMQAVNGTGARPIESAATPEAFGAGVGKAITGVGDIAQETVNKYQGLQNETLATNADASLSEKIGAIKGQYKSLSGQEAVNARQPAIDALNQAYQQTRASLPPMAAQGFDSMAKRSLGYSLGEVNEYWASNVKLASQNAHARTLSDAALAPKVDSASAYNDGVFDYHLGSIQYAAGAMLDPDHPGFDKDPDTGEIKGYKNNIDGQKLQATYKNTVDGYTGQAWKNRFDTLSANDPIMANNKFQQEKDRIPPLAAVDIQAKLDPQVSYAQANQTSQYHIVRAQQDYAQTLLNPPSNGPNPFNLGNVKTKSGAQNNTQEFLNPKSPLDGAIVTADTLRGGYNGMTLSAIGPKWTGEPDKSAAWIRNAASASGLDPNSPLDLNNPTTLASLLKGVSAAEKSPKDREAFTDDLLSRGAQASISGQKPNLSEQPSKTYWTNPDGSKVTQADFYSMNRENILDNVAAESEKQYPGDLKTAQMARELTIQRMDAAVKDQKDNYAQDNKQVIKGIFSDKPPTTLADLYSQPNMRELLNRVAAQDPKFFTEAIPKLIDQAQRQNTLTNSANAYDAIHRVLEPNDPSYPNRIASEDHLNKLLSATGGDNINIKDRNDAKKMLEADDGLKNEFRQIMQNISTANGNVDGRGKDRAVMWYNQAVNMKDANDIKTTGKQSDIDLMKNIKTLADGYMPSRARQIGQLASSTVRQPVVAAQAPNKLPIISSPNDPAFASLKTGDSFMTSDGRTLVKK